jgi:hypothetical protein
LLKCGSVHEADSGYSCGNLRHAVAEGNFRVPTSISLEKPFAQRAVVEANPIAAFDSSLTHHKASMGQTYMLAQKRLESAFLCIIQTFVEWLGGICGFFELDRDCFQLDRIRLELFSPFS